MTHSRWTTQIRESTLQRSSRNGRRIDRFIVHHQAGFNDDATIGMMVTGSKTVSANYTINSAGRITLVVDEDWRAWTSSSAEWDGRAVTVEIENSAGAPDWPISQAARDALSRLISDVASRYGFPIDRDHIITHQELYSRYGASYATACPGPFLQSRMDEVIADSRRAQGSSLAAPPPIHIPTEEEELMAAKDDIIRELKSYIDTAVTVGVDRVKDVVLRERGRLMYDSGPTGLLTEGQSRRAAVVALTTGFVMPLNSDPGLRVGQVTSLRNTPYQLIGPREQFVGLPTQMFDNMLEMANSHLRRHATEVVRQQEGGDRWAGAPATVPDSILQVPPFA